MKDRAAFRVAALLIVTLITGCSLWPPGKDPKGKRYIASSIVVCHAAEQFESDHDRLPDDLAALVPTYIDKLPEEPSLQLNASTRAMTFVYSPKAAHGRCICTAHIGECGFSCNVCYW